MRKYKPLTSILEAYKQQNAKLKEARKKRQEQSIVKLEVTMSDKDFLLSVDLDNASLPVIIHRVLDETKTPYLFDNVDLYGKITTRFDNIPLIQAMNLLLETQALSAIFRNEILIISDKPYPKTSASDSGSDSDADTEGGSDDSVTKSPVHLKVTMKYLDMDTVSTLLDGIYPDDSDGRLVHYGVQPNTNTVFLLGAVDDVKKAKKFLRLADRDPSHVVIECLVVEFDVDAFEQLGADIADSSSGGWSEISSNMGAAITSSAKSIQFTRSPFADYEPIYTIMVDALIAEDKARIISRPYISTLSGETATINITRDRHVVVQEVDSGASLTSTDPISSGVTLEITPTVLPDDLIRMVVNVEDSQFVTTSGNIVAEVDTNSAKTVMQIESGRSIIIGGLAKNVEATENSGLPWVRNIPFLNLFTSKPKRTLSEQEVMIYVTAHIWTPDMVTPLVEPGALEIKENSNPSLFEKLGKREEK
ncbi:MAG: type II and III secretion system protein [Candidatus Omnitrophica bacterium]|nr:type II and III secretion system protein [Candidatus Omnitrophota bacterium]